MLVEVFNEMTKHGENVCLDSPTFRVVVIGEDGAKSLPVNSIYRGVAEPVRSCGVDAWHSTVRALAASRLPLAKLNILNDVDNAQAA